MSAIKWKGLRLEIVAVILACMVAVVGAMVPQQFVEDNPPLGHRAPSLPAETLDGKREFLLSESQTTGLFFLSRPSDFEGAAALLTEFETSHPSVRWVAILSGVAADNATAWLESLPPRVIVVLDNSGDITNSYNGRPVRFYLIDHDRYIHLRSPLGAEWIDLQRLRQSLNDALQMTNR